MTRNAWKKWLLIAFSAIILALILSIGLLVRLQSVSAVKQLVEELSGGKYGFNASAIRVNPFTMTVRARDISIQPLRPGQSNNEFELRADSIRLNLDDVLRLILTRTLHVREFAIDRPSLVMRVYERDTSSQKNIVPLHLQTARMQEVFFQVLQSLEVRHCRLSDGTITYYPNRNQHANRYFLNHIYFDINDLHLLKKVDKWNRDNKVSIRFELRQPVIEYPDSTIRVQLDKLLWDTRVRRFDLTGLAFHKAFNTGTDSTGFRLEGIELDSLNWNKLLTEGKVELGDLKASKGYFSSNEFRFRKNRDSLKLRNQGNLLDVLGPILVKRLSIREIEFTGSTFTRRGKESIQIIGDNFEVTDLLVDKSLPNKVSLNELQMKVRAYLESDSNRTFQAGFGEMVIKKNDLVLKDYFLHSVKGGKRNQQMIDVKQLILIDLSVPDLINGKLKAKELIVGDPVIILHLPPSKKRNQEFAWQKLQRKVSRKLDIGTLRIRNATIKVHQQGKQKPLVNTDSFYAVISSRNMLRSRTLEELFDGESSLNMPRLVLQLDNFRIECRNALYDREYFYAASANGKSADGRLQFELNHVHAHDINTAGILSRKDSAWLRWLDIGSGKIYFKPGGKKEGKNPELPTDILRSIRSGKLDIHIDGADWTFRTSVDSLSLAELRYQEKKWAWDSLYLRGSDFSLKHPVFTGRGDSYYIGNVHTNFIKELRGHLELANIRTDLSIKELKVKHTLTSASFQTNNIKLVSLHHPDIRITLKEPDPDRQEKEDSAKQGTHLPALELIDPVIRLVSGNDSETKEIASTEGGRISILPAEIRSGQLSTGGIDLELKNIRSQQEKFEVMFPYLHLRTGSLVYKKNEPVTADIQALRINEGRFRFQKNDLYLSLGGIDAAIGKRLQFNSSRDSLKKLLTSLPHLDLDIDELSAEQQKRKVAVRNLRVDSDNKKISFDSIQWRSKISRDSFFAARKFQTDFIQLSAGAGTIIGYNMEDRGADTIWKLDAFHLNHLDMLVERDKRLPVDSISYRPLLTGMLYKLPLKFSLDKINLNDARIRYNEISDKNGKEGSIWFHDMDASIQQVRSFGAMSYDSLRITARTKLMGQGDLRFSFRESYLDSLNGFYMTARMGSMPLNALSPLLQPLFNLKVNNGTADSLWLRVKANDYLAFGHMELDYRHLNLSLLKEDGKKRGMTSFLINAVLRNKNERSGLVYRERLRNKSIFNYWGKIALSGLLTNMGVQRNRKYTKKYKKEMMVLDLPPDLLEN